MRSLAVAICVVLAACGHEGVSGETTQWHCARESCAVDFLVTNQSGKRQQVAYVLRAHLIRSTATGGGGAKTQETVGELHGEVELLGQEQRRMSATVPVRMRPTMIVTSAWVREL